MAICLAFLWPLTVLAQPTFTAIQAGLVQEYYGSATWADYNNDGNLDLLITGSLANNGHHLTQLYRNNGDRIFTPVSTGIQNLNRSAAAWGDYNNDGYLDLVISGTTDPAGTPTTLIYRNNGDGTFTDIQAGLPGLQYASLAWGDYDRDGRLDLVIAGKDAAGVYVTRIYRNNGDGTFTDIKANLPGVQLGSAAWGDYDNNGYLDLVLSGQLPSGSVISRIYRNNGDGTFSLTPVSLPGRYYSAAAWGDYDNDGHLDLALTGADANNNTFTSIYRNNGDGTFTSISSGLPNVAVSAVAWGDADNDGKLDLLIAGSTSAATGAAASQIIRNNGDNTFSLLATLGGVSSAYGGWGDYDNDGALDVVLTGSTVLFGGAPSTVIYRSTGSNSNTPPTAPDGLAVQLQCNSVILSWNAATDAQTPSAGLTYNVRVGTTPGGSDIVSPAAGASGRLRLPAMGNAQLCRSLPLYNLVRGKTYYWNVQAIDTGFAGSPFAPEATFVFNPTNSAPSVVNPIADFDVYPETAGSLIAVIDLRAVFQDAETAAADLVYALQTNKNPAVVSATVDSATQMLTLAYQSGSVGSAAITVRATDAGGCSAQDSFTVTVHAVPQPGPVITAQPPDQVALVGTDVSLSVGASDPLPLTYQWYRGCTNSPVLAGKTQATLLLTNVQRTNSGPYWVKVRDSAGHTVNSTLAWLTGHPVAATMTPIPVTGWNRNVVVTDPTMEFTTPFDPQSPITWFATGVLGSLDPGLPAEHRFGSRANTNVVFEFQPYDANNVLYMTTFQPVQQSGTLSLTAPKSYKKLALLTASAYGGQKAGMMLNFSDGTSSTNINIQPFDWFWLGNPGYSNVAFTGVDFAGFSTGVIGYTSGGLTTPTSSLGMYETDIDLVARGLDTKELISVTFTNSTGVPVVGIFAVSGEPALGTAPFVVADPVSQRVFANGSATFEAMAVGQSPLSYRWQKDSQPLTDGGHVSGVLTSLLTISNVTAADAGVYSLIVTNAAGSATSAGAVLDLFASTPLRLGLPGQLVGGALSIQLSGPLGLAGRLQRSSDLGTWQTWQTVTIGAKPVVVQDHVQGAVGQQFYRFVSP